MQRFSKIVLVLITLCITSCAARKDIVYFQKDEVNQSQANTTYKTIFKPDDLLLITISALDMEAVKPFNLPVVAFSTTTDRAVGTPQQQSYLIDNDGFIDFPILGKIKLGGLSRPEAIDLLKSKLSPDYIINPTINIRITNFSITVLGDVKMPGRFTIPNERISVLEAIGLAGDLNMSGIRNIEVKREENNQIKSYQLDLRSNKVFNSPAYYLQQNDVVYVEPNRSSSQDAAYNKNTGLFISLGSVIISLLTLLTR
ncbi:polysaccharide biosynthesis/export family protein [Tenacibaculum tangerinum]|uniref:Polysaccharide biosynthesis/export family protein n=1 Tax=Tenacibaculum tangerinum TaxID=3038772 RepID=A0ABY8L6P0_9FLAO|nr:polysaccharide biosynthesis/export family protein [Tenacibaculum tangerinum]WGH76941.1 polysaccharide biosynthesis/export family protein [Tenacibaculum tangerinum]